MTSSPELPRCDMELSLGRPSLPRRCRATGELNKSGGGLTATELQAMAILRVARRAAAEAEDKGEGASGDDGPAAGLSMRRSMEWFLQRRREVRRHRGGAAASPSSSSSFSCLTDSDSSRI